MKCLKIKENLADYLRDNLDSKMKGQVAEHLATCRDCAAELEFLKAYQVKIQSLKKMEAPNNLLKNIHQHLERPQASKGFLKLFQPMPVKIPAYAGTAVLIALLFYLFKPAFLINKPNQPAPPMDGRVLTEGKTTAANQPSNLPLEKAVAMKTKQRTPAELVITLVATYIPEGAVEDKVMKRTANDSAVYSEKEYSMNDAGDLQEKAEIRSELTVSLPEKIKALINSLGGLIHEQVNSQSKLPEQITIKIPSKNYQQLLSGLREFGEIKESMTASLSTTPIKDEQVILLKLQYQP